MSEKAVTLNFIDADKALEMTQDITQASELIRDIKAYLFDCDVLGMEGIALELSLEESKFVVKLSEKYLDNVAEYRQKLLLEVCHLIALEAIGEDVDNIQLNSEESTILWEMLEEIIERITDQ